MFFDEGAFADEVIRITQLCSMLIVLVEYIEHNGIIQDGKPSPRLPDTR